MIAGVAPVAAQMTGRLWPGIAARRDRSASAIAAAQIGFDQRLDERLPLDTMFRDEAGRDVPIEAVLRVEAGAARLRLRCPMLAVDRHGADRDAHDVARAGPRDFQVVRLSFDPTREAGAGSEEEGRATRSAMHRAGAADVATPDRERF
jgi:hypothetical protein